MDRCHAAFASVLTGLLLVLPAIPASAALIDIVVVGIWETTNNPVVNPFGLSNGDKFVVKSTYDDSTFFNDSGGVTAYVEPGINPGTSLQFIMPHAGVAPNPMTFDQSDHIDIGFAPFAEIEFDGPNAGSPGNFRNFEFHFENTFAGDSMDYNQFYVIVSETTIFNISEGGNQAATASGADHLAVVVNNITANAGGPYVFNAGNLSKNLSGTSGGGSGFTKDYDWTGPGGALANSPGPNIAFGLAESGLTDTADSNSIDLAVTENFTEFASGGSVASVSYQNALPQILSASATPAGAGSISFAATADDPDLAANGLVSGFESLLPIEFKFGGMTFLFGDGTLSSAQLSSVFGGDGNFSVDVVVTDATGAQDTGSFGVKIPADFDADGISDDEEATAVIEFESFGGGVLMPESLIMRDDHLAALASLRRIAFPSRHD